MDHELIRYMGEVGVSSALAVFAWMAKLIFNRIQSDIAGISKKLEKIDVRTEIMQTDSRIAIVKISTDVASIWHFIENERPANRNGH